MWTTKQQNEREREKNGVPQSNFTWHMCARIYLKPLEIVLLKLKTENVYEFAFHYERCYSKGHFPAKNVKRNRHMHVYECEFEC